MSDLTQKVNCYYRHEENQKIFFVFILLIACMVSSCSVDRISGNSSQTGNNGITVQASAGQITGKSLPDLSIYIYRDNYLPYSITKGFCDSIISDDSGHFAFTSISSGYYNLLARERVGEKSVFIKRIAVFTDSTSLLNDTLRKPGFLTGISTDKKGNNLVLSYVFVKGSPFYTVTDNSGKFLLGPIPPNNYTISFFANFIDIGNEGTVSPAMGQVRDSSKAVIYSDSISKWNW